MIIFQHANLARTNGFLPDHLKLTSWNGVTFSHHCLLILQGGVCLAFADEVLCWLYGTVKESKFFGRVKLIYISILILISSNLLPFPLLPIDA